MFQQIQRLERSEDQDPQHNVRTTLTVGPNGQKPSSCWTYQNEAWIRNHGGQPMPRKRSPKKIDRKIPMKKRTPGRPQPTPFAESRTTTLEQSLTLEQKAAP